MPSICGGFLGFATNTCLVTRTTARQHKCLEEERRTDLEHMERLELDVLAFVAEQVHHHLEVALIGYVARHHIEIGTIE